MSRHGAFSSAVVCATFIPALVVRNLAADLVWLRNPLTRYSEYKRQRGMSVMHDWIDWLGGYPFEVAKPEQVFDFFRERVYDLAGRGHVGANRDDPRGAVAVNVVGTANVLEACRHAGVGRVVFPSSALVYRLPARSPLSTA